MEEIDIKDMFKYFLNRYKFILKFILIFFIFGLVSSVLKFRVYYQADTNIIFENTSSSEISTNETLMPTYFEIAKSDSVINKVKENLNISKANLKNKIYFNEDTETKSVTISVRFNDKKLAEKIVNDLTDEFIISLKEHYPVAKVSILNYSSGAYLSSNVSVFKNVILLSMVGFILSCVVVFFIYYFDDKIRNKEVIKKLLGVISNKPKNNEGFRSIRTKLNLNDKDVILVTSYNNNEGKTYISSKLGETITDLNKKVLLIDCDVNNSELHKIYNVNNELGLVDINDKSIDKSIQKTDIDNLFVLPFGINNFDKKELFAESFNKELNKLKEKYDYIILDGTCLNGFTDSIILSKLVSKIILVTKYNYTKLNELEESLTMINPTGVVLNDVIEEDNFDKIKKTLKKQLNKFKLKSKKDDSLIKVNKKVVKISNKKTKKIDSKIENK